MPYPSPRLLPGPDVLPGAGPLEFPVARPGPVEFNPDAPARVIDFTFDLLDQDDTRIGRLNSVTGGSLSWDSTAAVHGTGSLDVIDIGHDIDWLNVRIGITAMLSTADGSADGVRAHPLGVFIPAAPSEKWTDAGRSWTVELTDKLALLEDSNCITNDRGMPVRFTATPGQNVVTVVTELIQGIGESTSGIEPGGATVDQPMVWDIGTPSLQIINDLLAASGHTSLWCDRHGQYRVSRYLPPLERPVVYVDNTSPLLPGQLSLVGSEWSHERDVYAVPNRVVLTSSGDGDTAGMVAVAENTDPASPFSQASRGRWVTHTETGVDAVTQQDLNIRADQMLATMTAIASKVELSHVFLPDLEMNATTRFFNPAADLSFKATVTATSVSLDPSALCSSTLVEVLA